MADDRLYFRQLLSGRDFATTDSVARQMVNFSYLIGDREDRTAVIVDPAYDIAGLLDILVADGMRCTGVLATHFHPDHVGGDLMGYRIEGITDLLETAQVPVHVQRDEAEWVVRATGVSDDELVGHDSGDVVTVGDVRIELVHTPGHTPGSQCLLVDARLVSGDTLFVLGCGRTDLPGSDPREMYRSLHERLADVGDDVVLYPGHLYAPESFAALGHVRATNPVMAPASADQWLSVFGP